MLNFFPKTKALNYLPRILLADDHEIMRGGLKLFIHSIIEQCLFDEAWDGDTTLQKVTENEYRLIILDINMPDTDSYQLVRDIISIKSEAKILMFSMNEKKISSKKYLQLGVKGYVSKTASLIELENAINAVLENK